MSTLPNSAASEPLSLRPLRVVIADDEPPARDRLKRLLAAEPGVEVIAECTNGQEALAAITTLDPDLALLDVRMPVLDGFKVAAALPPDQIRPVLVFVTAYDAFAPEAFAVHATDYLLKPCPPARLRTVLQRARALLAGIPSSGGKPPPLQRVIVRTGERMLVVPTSDVDWVESANNYVILHCGRTTHILRESLTELEGRLDGEQFMRISRFAIVNLARVREILTTDNGGHQLQLADGALLPVTRGIREIQARLETALVAG